MTKQLHTIRLNNPCQQKWTGMQESSMGRFCSECQKEVIDFTQFTNAELIDYFTTNKIKEGCGRFLTSQLNTVKIPVDIGMFERRRTPKWQKFLIVLLFCFGRSLFNAEVVFGQNAAGDSGRNQFFCDSSLPSETFDLKDTIKNYVPELDTVSADPGIVDSESVCSISNSPVLVFDTITYDISIVMGGFGMYPEYKCELPPLAMNDILSVSFEEDTKHVVENKSPILNPCRIEPDGPRQAKTPAPEEKNNHIPLEAILTDNNQNKRRRK